jgi:hypothetical protein
MQYRTKVKKAVSVPVISHSQIVNRRLKAPYRAIGGYAGFDIQHHTDIAGTRAR